MKDIIDLLGRIFLSIISIYEAIDSIFFYEKTKETMAEYGVTMFQDFFLISSIVILIIGAILVTIGYFAKFGAWLLIIYWIVATLLVFSFWTFEPSLRTVRAIDFMRNLSYIGGLLMVAANGAGQISIKRLIYVLRLPK